MERITEGRQLPRQLSAQLTGDAKVCALYSSRREDERTSSSQMAFALGHLHWASILPRLPLNQSFFNPSGLEGLALTTPPSLYVPL